MSAVAPVRERREALLRDARVKRWFKDHASGSTAEAQLVQFELFLRRTSLTVDLLLNSARAQMSGKSRVFEDAVQNWVESERKGGHPTRTSPRTGTPFAPS